jgi:deoxyribonuclease-4
MKYVGAHVPAQGGVQIAPLNAKGIRARAFALFTRNPRRFRPDPLTAQTVEEFRRNMAECGFLPEHVLPHAGYLLNLSHADRSQRRATALVLREEMERCAELGLKYLNTHPGVRTGESSEADCIGWIADAVNRALEATKGVTAVLETTAHRSGIGTRFEHLAAIIARIEDRQRVGVCFDTCHVFAAGYDVRAAAAFGQTLAAFDRVIGLPYLRAVHLNDSKYEFATHGDRHECIGKGKIGKACFEFLMRDPRFENIPLILETPEPDRWAGEIRTLYRFAVRAAPGRRVAP